jgi:polyisoprenoid-binding protein YceI
LRSADFFDVEKHPELTFTSAEITHQSGERFELRGLLTIKGLAQPVSLAVEEAGRATDPWVTPEPSSRLRDQSAARTLV